MSKIVILILSVFILTQPLSCFPKLVCKFTHTVKIKGHSAATPKTGKFTRPVQRFLRENVDKTRKLRVQGRKPPGR